MSTRTADRAGAAARWAGVAHARTSAGARAAGVLLALVTVLIVAAGTFLASRAPLWNDELFTYYIARLPTFGDVWDTLASGLEQVPPSFYALTRTSLFALGNGEVALRLPEILGFALMGICVYAFVAHRASPVHGLVALLVPLATRAWQYAYEARGYALVLGFGAAALVCWQRAAEGGRHRRLWCVGLALTLAGAVGSHYYAVLLLAPLLAGELARALRRRRVDWAVVAALAGALLPLVAFAPLVLASRGYSTTFWAVPRWSTAVHFYPDFLLTRKLAAGIVLLVGLGILAGLVRSRRRPARAGAGPPAAVPGHELVALAVLLAVPFLGVLVGKLATGAFTERYALVAVVGVAIAVGLAARQLDARTPILALGLILALGAYAVHRFSVEEAAATQKARDRAAALQFLRAHASGAAPTVVASPHDFFELSHLAARAGGPDLVYLAEPRAALRLLGTDAVDLGVVGMAGIAPLDVERYRPFLAVHPRFRVYGVGRNWDWLTTALRADGARTRVVARQGDDGRVLLEVRRRPGAAAAGP